MGYIHYLFILHALDFQVECVVIDDFDLDDLKTAELPAADSQCCSEEVPSILCQGDGQSAG